MVGVVCGGLYTFGMVCPIITHLPQFLACSGYTLYVFLNCFHVNLLMVSLGIISYFCPFDVHVVCSAITSFLWYILLIIIIFVLLVILFVCLLALFFLCVVCSSINCSGPLYSLSSSFFIVLVLLKTFVCVLFCYCFLCTQLYICS
jgi:hypothetical protein